jgi:hypothetical protein
MMTECGNISHADVLDGRSVQQSPLVEALTNLPPWKYIFVTRVTGIYPSLSWAAVEQAAVSTKVSRH